MPQIVVNIDPKGNAKVEAQGVVGPGCQDLTKNLERALGVVSGDQKKPEFYRATPNQQGQVQR